MRIVGYIRQHHIGLIALFIALTGTAYAGTQLASGPAHPLAHQAKKKKKKKPKLIPGPAGPQGPAGQQGPAGPPGAARAYAHVYHGGLVAADTTGVTAMTRGCLAGSGCTGVPDAGSQSVYVYCFQLPFTPTSIQITPDAGHSNPDTVSQADSWLARAPGTALSSTHDYCPPGYVSAEVDATESGDSVGIVTGLYITFN